MSADLYQLEIRGPPAGFPGTEHIVEGSMKPEGQQVSEAKKPVLVLGGVGGEVLFQCFDEVLQVDRGGISRLNGRFGEMHLLQPLNEGCFGSGGRKPPRPFFEVSEELGLLRLSERFPGHFREPPAGVDQKVGDGGDAGGKTCGHQNSPKQGGGSRRLSHFESLENSRYL